MTFRELGRIAAFCAAVLMVSAPALSQGQPKPPVGQTPSRPVVGQLPFKWWNSEQYRKELTLTPEQGQRLEAIFQEAAPTLRKQKQALDAAEVEFERLVERGNDKAVMAQVDRVETARAELNKSRTVMLLRMRRILTSDQWIKLGALQHQAAGRPQEYSREHAK